MAWGELSLINERGVEMTGLQPEYPEKTVKKKPGQRRGRRGSGILLHITSLPSPFGIGDLGHSAYRFVDFLNAAGQKYWQILPVNPTLFSSDNSPYLSSSAFAGNTNLISPELMVREGFLEPFWMEEIPDFPEDRVNYEAVIRFKKTLFTHAFERSRDRISQQCDYQEFCRTSEGWLEDYATFQALAGHYPDRSWDTWPRGVKYRHGTALARAGKRLQGRIGQEKFLQYVFFRQWEALRRYCRSRGVEVIGDLPLYVNYQSTDVWTCPELFMLDADLKPTAVAGVPPDYFSTTGQLWKNPLYRWEVHERTGFAWWIRRLGWNLSLFDRVRIDHFRGMVAYWEVPAGAQDATAGRWVEAPAGSLLRTLKKAFRHFPVIAEDLGMITPDVKAIMKKYHLPGMRVLQFAFTGDMGENPHAPANLSKNLLLYTGTHDNAPIRGWFEHMTTVGDKRRISGYLGRETTPDELPEVFIRIAMKSVADTAIIPMQDILGLGEEARMNTPGIDRGNWQWRMTPDQMEDADSDHLRELAQLSGRANGPGIL
jgi:4-alpha-glucanotransferase